MKFNKLVRDKIVENWNPKYGKNPKTHVASDAEFYSKLKEKLLEEVKEFVKDDELEEMADIIELVNAINEFNGVSKEEVEKVRREKVEKNGTFKKRLILESSEDK